ncbi:MAG: hypothetical protein JWN98_771 [Abditibacteriota bacterium]|nr:hypothetical protein [Abditibacteriota bacterium]
MSFSLNSLRVKPLKVLCLATIAAMASFVDAAPARTPAAAMVAPPTIVNEVPPPAQVSRIPYIARAQRIPLGPAPIQAKAYLLMDVDSGRVLFEHNARQRMFPASTTKTMTALVALEEGDLDSIVGIGPNPPQTGEQSIHLLEREKFALRDLVRAAMIKSANDSCVAVAEGVAGNVPAFVKLMNDKARAIGARNTHFVNPHGLHDPQHYSTAYDLALIARAAMRHPEFNRIIGTHQTTIHGNWKQGPVRPLINRNRLMLRWNACDGVKTGYTRQAGNCLVASATKIDADGKPWRLLAVALNSKETWNDCYNLLQKQGFERFVPQTVAMAGEIAAPIHVQGGAFEGVAIVPREVRVPVKFADQSTLTRRLHLTDVTAPVRQGQIVGTLQIEVRGQRVLDVPLVAKEAIPLSRFARVLPGAAPILPSDPLRRLLGYSLLMGAAALFLCALKARHQSVRRQRARRREARKTEGYPVENTDYPSVIGTASIGTASFLTTATDRVAQPSPTLSSVPAPRTANSAQPNSYETPHSLNATQLHNQRAQPPQTKRSAGLDRSAHANRPASLNRAPRASQSSLTGRTPHNGAAHERPSHNGAFHERPSHNGAPRLLGDITPDEFTAPDFPVTRSSTGWSTPAGRPQPDTARSGEPGAADARTVPTRSGPTRVDVPSADPARAANARRSAHAQRADGTQRSAHAPHTGSQHTAGTRREGEPQSGLRGGQSARSDTGPGARRSPRR